MNYDNDFTCFYNISTTTVGENGNIVSDCDKIGAGTDGTSTESSSNVQEDVYFNVELASIADLVDIIDTVEPKNVRDAVIKW